MKPSSLGIFLSFAPFIVFFVLASIVSPLAGLACGLILSVGLAILDRQHGKSFKILTIGSIVLFAVTIMLVALAPDLSADVIRLIVNGGLTFIAFMSLAIGRPFTLQYAREQLPEQYWNEPLFIRTNQLITAVWILAFALGTAAAAGSIYAPSVSGWFDVAVTVTGLVFAVWFTGWYPARVRGAVSAELL